MTALTQDRVSTEIIGGTKRGKVAATTQVFMGAIVMRNGSGYLTKGQTATALRGVGRATASVNNTGGAGAAEIGYDEGIFQFWATGTAFTEADIGKLVYAVDDQTVAKDDGTGTRSPAGFLYAIEAADSVFIEFDEAKLLAAMTAAEALAAAEE